MCGVFVTKDSMGKIQWKIETKIGPLFLVASEKFLEGVYFKKDPTLSLVGGKSSPSKILSKTALQLQEYFEGKRTKFDLPLRFEGTDFQKSVWRELKKIPFGKAISYKDLAVRIRNKNATRAVGTANGKNHFCIVVPCHRVIAADGTLGGFSGGLDIKKKLLTLENISVKSR